MEISNIHSCDLMLAAYEVQCFEHFTGLYWLITSNSNQKN